MISAKVVAYSMSESGKPLITLQTNAPKFLDAEVEKHRMLSSNSSSDRAIPLKKLIEKEYFIPEDVRLNQPGMQGDVPLSEKELLQFQHTLRNLYNTISSTLLLWDNVHKQHLNRYLLGFSMQQKIITATEWDNFFMLRLPFVELSKELQDKSMSWKERYGDFPDGAQADPAMQELARCMWKAISTYPSSKIKHLSPAEYHLPYLTVDEVNDLDTSTAIKCSVARLARVSYSNHDGTSPDVSKDLLVFDKLLRSKHMSPFEHIGTPMVYIGNMDPESWEPGVTHMDRETNLWSANFKWWIQYRKTLDG